MPVRVPDDFVPTMTPGQVKDEVMLIDIDNIRHFPISDSKRMDSSIRYGIVSVLKQVEIS